jgi:prepilin-type N-terminal cleavage/methylation domain-containing protein
MRPFVVPALAGNDRRFVRPATARKSRLKAGLRARGFTLVELLVTIAIISILLMFSLGAVFMAQESARGARTEAVIQKLHTLIIERWESYRTRRLPISTSGVNPSAAAVTRLTTVRQLMRVEMPDRYTDLLVGFTGPTDVVRNRPGLQAAYLRRLPGINGNSTFTQVQSVVEDFISPSIGAQNQSAECLYLIVTVGLRGDDRAVFKDRDIGDTDQDGMPEFIDAWGQPISFLRWAPGFVSDLQPLNASNLPDPIEHHDPFDPLRLQTSLPTAKGQPTVDSGESVPSAWGFALVPLIYSAGPDRQFGIHELHFDAALAGANATKSANPYSRYRDPPSATSGNYYWRGEGRPDPATSELYHFDNIYNHVQLGIR